MLNEKQDQEELCGLIEPYVLPFQILLGSPLQFFQAEIWIRGPRQRSNFENFRKYHSWNYFPDRVCPGLRCRNQQFPSYTVSPNSHFRLKLQDSSKGTILPQPGLDKTLDREEQPEIRLTLQALDGGIPPKSGTAD